MRERGLENQPESAIYERTPHVIAWYHDETLILTFDDLLAV